MNMAYDEKIDEICNGEHILEPLDDVDYPKVYNIPPYSLTVPDDKVKEIKLPKPSRKIFWNNLI